MASLVLGDLLSSLWLPRLPAPFPRALRCPFESVAGACREPGSLGGPGIHCIPILKTRNEAHSEASNSVPMLPVVVNSQFPLSQAPGCHFPGLEKDGGESCFTSYLLLSSALPISLENSSCHCRPKDSGKPSHLP